MKKSSLLLVIAVLVMTVFVACSGNPDSFTGEVRIRIADTTRGISPEVSMDVSEYRIQVMDSEGGLQYQNAISKSTTTCAFRLPAGTYSISVDAYNADGIKIGSGSLGNAVVKAGQTNTFSISVFELEGEGAFAVRINANDGYGLSLKVFDSSENQVYDGTLGYSSELGAYVDGGTVILNSGFYRFEVYSIDSEKPIKMDTFRIVKDNTTTYSATFSFSSTGSIEISNEILSTPTVVIDLEEASLAMGETLHASASISGIEGAYEACWFIDNVRIGSYGSYADLSHDLNGLEVGTHSVSIFVRAGSVVWSESIAFTILDTAPASMNINASSLGENAIVVSGDTNITLNNMDPDKVYGVRVVENDGSSARGLTSTGVFKGSDNTYIPIPDASNCAGFDGASLGIRGNGKIRIVELYSGTGPMVLSEANDPISYYSKDGARVYEKFFNVKFNQEPYRNLDKSRVALLMYCMGSGSGISTNWGYVTNGAGGLQPEGFTPGLYDFSHVNHINLYIYNSIIESNGKISSEMVVMNPVVCEEGTWVDLVNKIAVYAFTPSETNGKYVMEISKNPGYSYSDSFNLRMIDGAFSGFVLPLSSDNEKNVYYLGDLSSELLVDISLYLGKGASEFGSDLGSVLFRPATQSEIEDFNNHVVSVNYDKTVFSKRLEPGDGNYIFYLEPNGDFVPNNSILTVEYKCDNGEYLTDSISTNVKSGHTYGVGYSGNSISGSYGEFRVRNSDYVVEVELRPNRIEEPVTATVTLERSNETILSDNSTYRLFFVPNNGEDIEVVTGSRYDTWVVPELTREDYVFDGVRYAGNIYRPGSTITIDQFYASAVGIWKIDESIEKIVFDPETQQYQDVGDGTNYGMSQIRELLEGEEYQTVTEYLDGNLNYGKITYDVDAECLLPENVVLVNYDSENSSNGFAVHSFNEGDPSKSVRFEIEKIVSGDFGKKLVGRLTIGNQGTVYENVEFRQVHKHDWALDDGTAVCNNCDETRACIELAFAGQITLTSDVGGLMVFAPDLNFVTKIGTEGFTFPEVPENTQVIVLAPSSEYNLTYELNGQTLAIHATADRTV